MISGRNATLAKSSRMFGYASSSRSTLAERSTSPEAIATFRDDPQFHDRPRSIELLRCSMQDVAQFVRASEVTSPRRDVTDDRLARQRDLDVDVLAIVGEVCHRRVQHLVPASQVIEGLGSAPKFAELRRRGPSPLRARAAPASSSLSASAGPADPSSTAARWFRPMAATMSDP